MPAQESTPVRDESDAPVSGASPSPVDDVQLLCRVTTGQAEDANLACAGPGPAPATAFGSRNAEWRTFVATLQLGDELWAMRSLAAAAGTGVAVPSFRHGYAAMRRGDKFAKFWQ